MILQMKFSVIIIAFLGCYFGCIGGGMLGLDYPLPYIVGAFCFALLCLTCVMVLFKRIEEAQTND